MRNHLYGVLGLIAMLLTASASANAASVTSPGTLDGVKAENAGLIKVHSRQRVHDKLHRYGYNRVIFVKQYYDYDDKPVYRFTACKGWRKLRIDVNWYGDIVRKHRIGKCYRERYRDRDDSYEDDYND